MRLVQRGQHRGRSLLLLLVLPLLLLPPHHCTGPSSRVVSGDGCLQALPQVLARQRRVLGWRLGGAPANAFGGGRLLW